MAAGATQGTRRLWPRGLGAVLDFSAVNHRRALAFLTAICLLAFLPGFFQLPPFDRDEARFAQAAKQMIETGDYVDIRVQDEVRYKKPVGIYWMQVAAVKSASALGMPDALTRISLYRLPSLAGAIGAVLLTYWAALAFIARRAAVLAGLMMAVCITIGVEARLAKTDAVLLACVVATMGATARIYFRRGGPPEGLRRRIVLPAIFWTALAFGILIKGPLIVLFVGLALGSICILDRSVHWLRELRPVPGIVWALALTAPWFAAIAARSGAAFFEGSVGDDMFAKIFVGQESHGAPPGYYLVLFFVTFWPGAALAGLAAPAIWHHRRQPGARFLLAWLVPAWIVFELVATKLPHYTLPAYPAAAILIAGCVHRSLLSRNIWLERGLIGWFLTPLVIAIGAVSALIYLQNDPDLLAWPFYAAAFVFGFRAWWLYDADGAERSLLRAAAASICVAVGTWGVALPAMTQLFPAASLAAALRGVDCQNPAIAAAGYQETSLVFLAGTAMQMTDGPGAADFLRRGGCRFALIEQRHERSFAQRADAIGLRYSAGARVAGINIGNGRAVSVAIFRSGEEP